jgi:amino acid adenylation domain-containing protein
MSKAKRDLLQRCLLGEIKHSMASPRAINRRAPGDLPQLSFGQERLWFLDQLMPGSPVFNIPIAVRLSTPISLAVLEQSLNEIVRRHDALRTTFATIDGKPKPVITPNLNLTIPVVDLSGRPQHELETMARQSTNEEALRPFDLAEGPLVRVGLIRLGEDNHVLLVTTHHIISDGWSTVVFFEELSRLYEAFSKGEQSPLPELPIQFADYAAWQREGLQGQVLDKQVSYWKEKLGGDLPVLDFLTDRPRATVQTYRGARESLVLSQNLTEAILALSQREGATLFMTLLAAFNILLFRHTGLQDIIVGSPISNRPQTETEGLIGFFLNNLALRTDLSGNPSFRDVLARVRQTALEAYANQDVPFEKLLEELRPERDLSRTTLFQVYLNLLNFNDELKLPGSPRKSISLFEAWLESDENLSKFDLTLYAGLNAGKLNLALVYNTDLFELGRIVEMLEQFQHLLSQIVTHPDEKITRFSLITSRSRELLPNPTQALTARPSEAIQTMFSQQAQRIPENLAIIDPQTNWTYQQLDSLSNRLANYLLVSGIRSQDIVAIYGHRSSSLVLGLLGVLKAGAAFVVLDPAYPVSRLIDCIQIAAPRGWLQIAAAGPPPEALDEFVDSLSCCCRLELPTRDCAESLLAAYPVDNPNVSVGADDLAYVAFTSGSTGSPKGILGRHGPLTLFASWAQDTFGLNESERFSMLSGLSHDPLHRDIFTPLQLGATICIPNPEDLGITGGLATWMNEQKITVINLTPAMAQFLCESTPGTSGEQIPSLRYSFLVGDVLTRRDAARLKNLAPSLTCVNLYGSTETQRAVGYFIVPPLPERFLDGNRTQLREREILPLGRGIKDVQLLVLNSSQELSGIGEMGEIYFRSPHLARGYLGDAALTQERFLLNPFTKVRGDRLYKTGDRGRYLPDGNLAFIGRVDGQVKIRGFRIELGEVEGVLNQHPSIKQSVVVAREDTPGERRLVAYVVLSEEVETIISDLRRWVKQRLPDYMVPSGFVLIDELPLTANGKLDRHALPAPDGKQFLENAFVAPRNPLELLLTETWEKVLEVQPIGVKDNFFDLGGHSLLAVRLFAQLEKVFDKKLPLATLFQAPTVEDMSKVLLQDGWQPPRSVIVAIQPSGTKPPFFCMHAAGGSVLFYRDLSRRLGPDQPFYGIQWVGLNGQHPSHACIEEIAAHYIREVRSVQPKGPYYLGGASLGGLIAFEMACQLHNEGQKVALLALFDTFAPGYYNSVATRSSRSRVLRLYRRIEHHLGSLMMLDPSERIAYVRQKLRKAKVLKWWRRSKRTAWASLYEAVGHPVSKSLPETQDSLRKAAKKYKPRPYPGIVTLFRASQQPPGVYPDSSLGWNQVTVDNLEIYEVPGYHAAIVSEPRVRFLIEPLQECLRRAHSLS